jgi:hypothetical protein
MVAEHEHRFRLDRVEATNRPDVRTAHVACTVEGCGYGRAILTTRTVPQIEAEIAAEAAQ